MIDKVAQEMADDGLVPDQIIKTNLMQVTSLHLPLFFLYSLNQFSHPAMCIHAYGNVGRYDEAVEVDLRWYCSYLFHVVLADFE